MNPNQFDKSIKRILTIDGGGVKGIYSIAVLCELENEIKKIRPDGKIQDYFDLIAGTSTGGIIALGLGKGLAPADLLSMYRELSNDVFEKNWLQRKIKACRSIFWGAQYDIEKLKGTLHENFKDSKLGDSTVRLLIPTTKESGEPCVFKTRHHRRYRYDYLKPMAEIALKTAAAPSTFDLPLINGLAYLDGGLWANNPTLVATIEAKYVLEWEKIRILNIGSVETFAPRVRNISSKINWASRIASLLIHVQTQANLNMANIIICGEGKSNFIDRIFDHLPDEIALDNLDEIDRLVALGRERARNEINNLFEKYFKEVTESFVPIGENEDMFLGPEPPLGI